MSCGFLFSCTGAKPLTWVDYFMFVTSEDKDLFNSYSEYDVDKLVYGLPEISRGFDYADSINGFYRFGLRNHIKHQISYIDYGNGDIDTLTLSWKPSSVPIGDVFKFKDLPFKAVDEVSIYFNGELVVLWDFIKDPGLKLDYPHRNSYNRVTPDYDPFVIILQKDPDWNELN